MIKEITYDQALELSKKYKDKDKITLILFKDEHCPFCNEFIPDVLEKILPDFQQHIDFYIVPNFEGNPFPPPTTPVTYIYVPGKSKNKMPLIRPGAADINNVSTDLRRCVSSLLDGLDLDEPRLPV